MQACVSGLKAYKRGYVYWYMHMIAPPSEDNVGHFFKVQKSRMMLLHVCVNVCTVRVCVCVCTLYACASVCVLVSVQMYSHCSCKPYMLVELFNHMTHSEHREQDSWSNTQIATQ